MKNVNYNLIKMLHAKLDNVWRLENYYVKDAEDAGCHSVGAMKTMLEDEQKHVEMLKEEIKLRLDSNAFD